MTRVSAKSPEPAEQVPEPAVRQLFHSMLALCGWWRRHANALSYQRYPSWCLLFAAVTGVLMAAGCSGETNGAASSTSASILPTVRSTAGSLTVVVPELSGMAEVDARKAAEDLGLVVNLEFISAPQSLSGTVVAVRPASGSAMAQRGILTLVIAAPTPPGEVEEPILPEAVGRLLGAPDLLGVLDRGQALTFVVWADTDLSVWEERLQAVGIESPSFHTCAMTLDDAVAVLEDVQSGWWKDDPSTFYAFRPDPETCTVLVSSLDLSRAETRRLVDRHGDRVSFRAPTSVG